MKITVINFTYGTSKSREYYGCHVVTGHLDGVKVRQTGFGYDMVGAILSAFINDELVSQNYLDKSSCNSKFNQKTGKYYVNLCLKEAVHLLEDYGFSVKLNYLKGLLLSVILVK